MKNPINKVFLYKKRKGKTVISLFILFVVLVILYLNNFEYRKKQHTQMEIELTKLESPPNAIVVKTDSFVTISGTTSIGKNYYIDWDMIDVINYYYKGLNENGWKNTAQEEIHFNKSRQEFCKGDYTLDLENYVKIYQHDYSYSIWITWNKSSECESDLVSYFVYFWYKSSFLVCLFVTILILLIQIYRYLRKNNYFV